MRLMIIGDLNGQFGIASNIAISRGAKVKQAETIDIALNMLRSGNGSDLIMIDVAEDVAKLIYQLNQEHIHIPVIGCGFNNSSKEAVDAIKAGAKEYIPLPPDEELIVALFETITKENRNVVYKSNNMKQVIDLADSIAKSNATVLITGESGTGKEVMARYIHNQSKRAHKDFISVNCAAIPENLIESELFGHEKGAFTGAIAKRVGKFEEANHSTLLLDEISEIDFRIQAKLLRAIQEQEIDRVGGSKPVKLDLRIIATSNRDLQLEVKENRFREDLFFRLNIINLKLPPLRERKEDIYLFINYFIEKYSNINNLPIKSISKEALKLMIEYDWPGNIRELENALHRAVLLAKDELILPDNLMLNDNNHTIIQDNYNLVGKTLREVEEDLIISTLKSCKGNRNDAANLLGISIKALRSKLDHYIKDNKVFDEV